MSQIFKIQKLKLFEEVIEKSLYLLFLNAHTLYTEFWTYPFKAYLVLQ